MLTPRAWVLSPHQIGKIRPSLWITWPRCSPRSGRPPLSEGNVHVAPVDAVGPEAFTANRTCGGATGQERVAHP
eukprot:13557164-Alexandrium_andersonii.AAC.1